MRSFRGWIVAGPRPNRRRLADSVQRVPHLETILSTTPEPVSEPLPQRDDAERCDSVDSDRRCVLPVGHQTAHVYPPADVLAEP